MNNDIDQVKAEYIKTVKIVIQGKGYVGQPAVLGGGGICGSLLKAEPGNLLNFDKRV